MSTTSINASSPAAVTSSLTPGAANTPLSDANAAQDRFLKLLVAQLHNQDPMNPMDNAQMTSQMAQINTVSGINQLNETMKSMSSQFLSMQVLQSASMAGHDVLLDGNTMTVSNGVAKGAFDLTSNADKVSVDIMTPGGTLIDTLQLGVQSEGRHSFDWDASRYQGQGQVQFKVSASSSGSAVSASPLSRDTIASIGNDNGSMSLQLKGRNGSVAYNAIKGIF